MNCKGNFDVVFPIRMVEMDDFGYMMADIQSAVNRENADEILSIISHQLNEKEKRSLELKNKFECFSEELIKLHKDKWDGIWIRVAINFMRIARLGKFDLIVGNPPWVKWEHLPTEYAKRIKELCNIRHIFSTRGRFGGTQLNICALISNVAAANWLDEKGVLAFLMPDSIMSQNSYEEFRYFYLNYETKKRLYLQQIDKWEKPLRPFRCEDKAITQDFITYYFSSEVVDYKKGIKVTTISRKSKVSDDLINKNTSFEMVRDSLIFGTQTAAQISDGSSAFSYLSNQYDFSIIIGKSDYEYRTGVEFTPQELYMLCGKGKSNHVGYYLFDNKKFARSKYIVDDMPPGGWELPTEYIYPIVTGPSIVPFSYENKNEYCVFPYAKEDTKNPITKVKMMKDNYKLYQYLSDHYDLIDSQSEKSKDMHRGEEFYALSKIGPYTFSEIIVAARDNTKFCASIIEPSETAWGEKKQTICVKHTMLIGRDLAGIELTKDEAYYICGILNSSIVIDYMQNTFKSNGYSLKKAGFYLPKYNPNNPIQKEIRDLSKKASENHDMIPSIQQTLTDKYIRLCSAER